MEKIKIAHTEEYIYKHILDSGLELFMIQNQNVSNFYITLNVKYGSVHNNFKYDGRDISLPKGIAHFLEHLMFNMPENENVFEYFSKLGSSINAFTTYEYTSYEVLSNTKFKENLTYLLKYVYTPHFNEEIVEEEKDIIIEEIKMIKGNPSSQLVYGMYYNTFINDERKYSIAGRESDILKITKEDIILAYQAFYHPSNMFLVITGNFDPAESISYAEETLEQIKFPNYIKPIFNKNDEPKEVSVKYKVKKMAVDRDKIALAIKIPKNIFKAINISDLELKIYLSLIFKINFGETSLLKEKLLLIGMLTGDISTYLTTTDDHYVVSLFCSTYQPDLLIEELKNQIKIMDITKDQLDRKTRTLISSLILCFDDIEIINSDIQEDIIYEGRYVDNIYEYYQSLNILSAKKVLSKLQNHNISVTLIKAKSGR